MGTYLISRHPPSREHSILRPFCIGGRLAVIDPMSIKSELAHCSVNASVRRQFNGFGLQPALLAPVSPFQC